MNNCAIDNLTLYTLHVAASVGRDPFAFVSSISPFPLFFLLIALPSPPLDLRKRHGAKKAVQLSLSAVTKRVESDSNRVPITPSPSKLLLSRSFSRTTSMIDRP